MNPAWVVFALSLSVMVGWSLHITALVSVSSEYVTMKMTTAAGFLLTSLGCLAEDRDHWSARVYGGMVLLLVAGMVLGSAGQVDLNVFRLEDKGALHTASPGLPSPGTALSFFLFGSALIWGSLRGLAVVGGTVISVVALTGYAVGEPVLYYRTEGTTAMALHTAGSVLLVSMVLSREDKE